MVMDYGRSLYATTEKIDYIGEKIGRSGVAGIGCSSHRGGGITAPKLSSVASILDALFQFPKSMSVYTSPDTVFVEIKGEVAAANDTSILFTEGFRDVVDKKYRLIADLLKSCQTNSELDGAVRSTIDAKGTDSAALYLMCDSYYYGNASKDNKEVGEITQAEIEAGFRSGLLQSGIDIIPDNLLGKSTYMGATATAKKEKATKKKETVNFIEEVKKGKYVIPYSWPEELKRFIKPVSFLDGFESTPEFEEIVKKIYFRATRILERMDMGLTGEEAIGKDYLNIMLLGKPGTGKTTLAYALSAATGMPVCTTAWNKHSDEDEVEGKTKIVDGKPTFCVTNSLLFHEFGGIDVNEEINLADPSVTMGSLGQKLEYPFIVKKNGYEDIKRHPLNVVIGTMNVGTNGSNPLNQALANRFKTPYILDDPTRETFINIIEKASGKSRDVCEWVYNAYEATCQYLRDPDVNEEEICQNLSIRTCLGAIENMEEGQSPVRALINSIVGAVAVVDLEVARNLQREKIEVLPNPKFAF